MAIHAPNESDLGVRPSEFNTIAEDDYRPDSFSRLSRWAINAGGLLLIGGLLAGCLPKPPGPEGGGSSDSNTNTDSLCSNLLRIAAANSVDVAASSPAWQAADQAQLQQDIACFVPESTSLTIGEILTAGPNAGEEVIQLAWARGGEVIPLLAVPGTQVDDLQLVNFLDPHTGQWEALTPDQAQTQLAAVNINSASGDIETEDNGAVVTATRDFNKNISFQIVNPDGTQAVLTAEQIRNNPALALWLEQVENLLKGQEILTFRNLYPGHITLSVPGMPENIATSMRVENMNIDSNVVEALNMQGYSPVISYSGTNFVGSRITVGGNRSALVNAPERLINYGGAGKLRLGEGTVLYGKYGETPLVRLLTLVPFEQNDGVYFAGAFVTKDISGHELGSFVMIFFDGKTGQVVQTLFAEFPESRNLRVEWQETGRPIIYFDGQKQEH